MLAQLHAVLDRQALDQNVSIHERQAPLRTRYDADPAKAWVTDSAKTSSVEIPAARPLYTHVTFGVGLPADQFIGVHKAVGGKSDFPCPGDIFAAAIASCLDSSTRMIANILGLRLERLEVSVKARADVRGALRMEGSVPVGFQHVDVSVCMKGAPGVTDDQLEMLLNAAEQSCVLLQTLKSPPSIQMSLNK